MTDDRYDRHRERAAEREAEKSRAGREIGELPAVANPKRRARCETEFRQFCELYFPNAFHLGWSDDHLRVLARIEQAVLHGGLFALAMPRGSGKTTLATRAVIWAALYGHHAFAMLICADEDKAKKRLADVKIELEQNEQLRADFPEVCYPIQKLERIANRAKGQTYDGQPTRIEWGKTLIVLPTIPGSAASGAVIGVGGITGAIRGASYTRPDGRVIRPSFAVLDDPQTRESAASPLQCRTREQTIAADVLGLAGPGEPMAAVMPCTVICRGDAADHLLDRKLHPDWQGERTKLLYSFPADMDLWDEYREVRAAALQSDDPKSTEKARKKANAFYKKHRKKMDAGGVVAWEARKRPDELSALQHAMNLYFLDPEAFFSEYQNEPIDQDEDDDELRLSADDIAAKVNGYARRHVPIEASRLTAFIDVQQKLLYYVVCAWEEDFTGYVIDYGAWPDQRLQYFSLRDARPTLAMKAPRAGLEGSIYNGLTELTTELLDLEWKQDGGAVLRIERLLIDANWGDSTDVVYQFCRQSKHAAVIMPSHGKYVGAAGKPFSEYKRVRGDRVGHNWRIPNVRGRRAVRHVLYDTNYWKTFTHARLAVPMGDRGCLSLWKAKPHVHRMFSEHLTAEFREKTEGRGRTVHEWKQRPGRDNHLFDCVVGCAVGASMQGITLKAVSPAARQPAAPNKKSKKKAKYL